MSTDEMNFEDRKKILCEMTYTLQADADKIMQVAPNSLPYEIKCLLNEAPEKVAASLETFLEKVPEEQRPMFLESLIIATDRLQKGHAELIQNLSRRIQPEDQPRTPPRKFQGFKKRRGQW